MTVYGIMGELGRAHDVDRAMRNIDEREIIKNKKISLVKININIYICMSIGSARIKQRSEREGVRYDDKDREMWRKDRLGCGG